MNFIRKQLRVHAMFQFSLKQLMLVVAVIGTFLAFAVAWRGEGIFTWFCIFVTLTWGRHSIVVAVLFGGIGGGFLSCLLAIWWFLPPGEAFEGMAMLGVPGCMMFTGGFIGAVSGGLYARRCIRREIEAILTDP